MKIRQHTNDIVKMYVEDGKTTTEISKHYGCSSSVVGRLLRDCGIELIHTPNELNVSAEDVNEIVRLYISGSTSAEIGEVYGICDGSVRKILTTNGVEIRRGVRRSNIAAHDYFHSIDTIGKAYFLGWMIADGCVIENKTRPGRSNMISLEIQSGDRYILEMFAQELMADQKCVKDFVKRQHSYFRFASTDMSSDLAKYGVVPRKTWSTYLPEIRQDLMPHLIRGYFDGNGTVTIDKYGCKHFAFYGSERICTEIRDYLHSVIGLNQNKVSKSTCYHVWWGGETPTALFSSFIYSNCGEYYLKRKRDKFNS